MTNLKSYRHPGVFGGTNSAATPTATSNGGRSQKRLSRNGGCTNGPGGGNILGLTSDDLDRIGADAMAKCGCKRCITREMNNPVKALNSVSKIDR